MLSRSWEILRYLSWYSKQGRSSSNSSYKIQKYTWLENKLAHAKVHKSNIRVERWHKKYEKSNSIEKTRLLFKRFAYQVQSHRITWLKKRKELLVHPVGSQPTNVHIRRVTLIRPLPPFARGRYSLWVGGTVHCHKFPGPSIQIVKILFCPVHNTCWVPDHCSCINVDSVSLRLIRKRWWKIFYQFTEGSVWKPKQFWIFLTLN